MTKLFRIAFAGALLVGCNQRDSVAPRAISMESKHSDFPVVSALASKPTFVGAAAAAAKETAALDAIRNYVPSEMWPAMASALQTPGHAITSTANPVLTDLIRQYYEARSVRSVEDARETSVATARKRGTSVTLAIAQPPSGTVASVIRRRLVFPQNVIVVGPDATPETVAGALSALDQSRARHGDASEVEERIGLRDARVIKIDPAYRQRLTHLLAKLRVASPQAIEGVGSVKAIVLHTRPLDPPASGTHGF